MEGFITRTQLNNYDRGLSVANERITEVQAKIAATYPSQAEFTLFLSHSRKDNNLLTSAAQFLRSHGIKVYVDWLDEGMPDTVSGDTAKKLKERIAQQRKFVVLVTENSKDSRWVPWELGYADSKKGMEHVAAFPVRESDRTFTHNEYLQIYPRIEYYKNRWIVWTADPAKLIDSTDWLRAK